MGSTGWDLDSQLLLSNRNPRHSSLGSVYQAPRVLYVTIIPPALGVTGLIAWIASNEAGMVAAGMVGTLVTFYLLWDWLLGAGSTRFSTLLGMNLLLGYAMGAMNTWLTLPRAGLSLSSMMGMDPGILCRGLAAVLFTSAVLIFVGELYEKPVFGRELRLVADDRSTRLVYVGTFLMLIGFLTKQVGVSGVAVGEAGQLSIFASFIQWFEVPIAAFSVAIAIVTPRSRRKVFTALCALALCLMTVSQGRRALMYAAVEILLMLRLTGFRFKGGVIQKLLIVGALAAFVVLGSLSFMLLRIAGYSSRSGAVSIPQRLALVAVWVKEGKAVSMAVQATQSNVQTRTFVLGFFADILEQSSNRTPMMGRDAVGLAQIAIPHLLYAEKNSSFNEEQEVDKQFALTYGDAANSILTNGAADFGIFGVFLYPLLAVWLYVVFFYFIKRFVPTGPAVFMTLTLVLQMLQTETTTTGYLITIRSCIIFSLVLLILNAMPSLRLQR
jgi:hypothetical protein